MTPGRKNAHRSRVMESDPEAFFVTDHYGSHPAVVVSLAKVRRERLAVVLAEAWRHIAAKRLVAEYDKGR